MIITRRALEELWSSVAASEQKRAGAKAASPESRAGAPAKGPSKPDPYPDWWAQGSAARARAEGSFVIGIPGGKKEDQDKDEDEMAVDYSTHKVKALYD